jgi:hypothetical protein
MLEALICELELDFVNTKVFLNTLDLCADDLAVRK